MNKSIVDRIDQMGGKIDELENSIQELVKEASDQAQAADQQVPDKRFEMWRTSETKINCSIDFAANLHIFFLKSVLYFCQLACTYN